MRINQKQLHDRQELERIEYYNQLKVKLQQLTTKLQLMQEKQLVYNQLKELNKINEEIEELQQNQLLEKKNVFNPYWDGVAAMDVAYD